MNSLVIKLLFIILTVGVKLFISINIGSRACQETQTTMAASYKNPPNFEDGTDYDKWKNEVEIWRLVTELPKKKQALAVTLTLTGKARETATQVNAEDLHKDDGMDTLIEALDSAFLKEAKDRAYEEF